MRRPEVLSIRVPPYEQRRREIEAEPLPRNLGALIDEVCAAAPNRLAWNFFEGGGALTYRELRSEVKQLASGLQSTGVGKGTHVGVILPNIPEFPLTWLALAQLGAVMVPVNTRYTAREVHYVLDDAEVDLVVVHEEFFPLLEGELANLPRLNRDRVIIVAGSQHSSRTWDEVKAAGSGRTLTEVTVEQDDLLNIQYTSGTTGFPKGCLLTQRYWLTIGKVNAKRDGRAFRHILASTPFFYMDPQWQLMMSFYQHATLHVAYRQSALSLIHI